MFSEIISSYNEPEILETIYSKTSEDVEKALKKSTRDLEDFKALISPAASPYLEDMAKISNQLTLKRFGKTIQLYIPMYVSNFCENTCIYCGFNCSNKINRVVLTIEQIEEELREIKKFGFEHLLIVSGEAPKKAGLEYFLETIRLAKKYFSLISFEVQPLDQNDYSALISEGLHSVYIYQETYIKNRYGYYHPRGKKSDYTYRINTPDRLGVAGIKKIGLGCLLGLEDWRLDSFFTALHLKYLQKKYWRTKYSISFPRLRPHAGSFNPSFPVNDKELTQLICAYRLLDEDVEMSISVRESEIFRNNIIKLGITSMSAGSKTEPGGYALNTQALEQFSVNDNRTPKEVSEMIRQSGYEAVWKDWDSVL